MRARSYRKFAICFKTELTSTISEGFDKFVRRSRMKHMLTNDSLHPIASQLSMLKLLIVLHCYLLKQPTLNIKNFNLLSPGADPENFGGRDVVFNNRPLYVN